MAFDPSGTKFATASGGAARLWDTATGKPLGSPIMHHAQVSAVAFSPDGTRLATASWDNTAHLWDAASGQPLGEPMYHDSAVNGVTFSKDGTRLATASQDNTVRLWDATTGKPLASPTKQNGMVRAVSFSKQWNGEMVAAFSSNLTKVVTYRSANNNSEYSVCLRDTVTGKPLGKSITYVGRWVDVALGPDCTKLVTGIRAAEFQIWDITTGKPFGEPIGGHGNFTTAATFSPDGTKLATAACDNTARLWDTATGKPLCPPIRHDNGVSAVAFSPDGTTLATAGGDKAVRLWGVMTGRSLGLSFKHNDAVNAVAFSPDGTKLATAGGDKTALLWDVTTGRSFGPPMKHDYAVKAMAFSPDGTTLATACGISQPGTGKVCLWDAVTCQPLGLPMQNDSWNYIVAFSPDGTELATASFNTARFFTVPRSMPDDPRWVTAYVEVISTWRADSAGLLRRMSSAETENAWREVLKSPRWLAARPRFATTFYRRIDSPGDVRMTKTAPRPEISEAKTPESGTVTAGQSEPQIVTLNPRQGQPEKSSESGTVAANYEHDREVAKFAISIGGGLEIELADGESKTDVKSLPDVPFRITRLWFRGSKQQATDRDLKCLRGLDRLRYVDLVGSQASDETLKILAELPNLEDVWLFWDRYTDARMAHLGRLKHAKTLVMECPRLTDLALEYLRNLESLEHLNVDYAQIKGIGLTHLRKMAKLKELWLYKTQIDDAGIAHLPDLPSLETVCLNETRTADAGLEHLSKYANLQELFVEKTKVTGKGLLRIHKLRPGCTFHADPPALEESYTLVLQEQPDNVGLHKQRAELRARYSHKWSAAAEDLAKVIELDPQDVDSWYHRTMLLVQRQQKDRLSEHLGKMLATFQDNSRYRCHLIYSLTTFPTGKPEMIQGGKLLAEELLYEAPESPRTRVCVALVRYRAGMYKEAESLLSQLAAADLGIADYHATMMLAFHAMTKANLNDQEAAKELLSKAKEAFKKARNDNRGTDYGDYGENWWDRLSARHCSPRPKA